MHINRSVLSQQHRVQRYAAASDAFGFFNQLTSPDLLDTLESTLPDHRERLFPPTETLSMFLAQALKPDRSCHNENDIREDFGPNSNTKTKSDGSVVNMPGVANAHRTHIHVSGQ